MNIKKHTVNITTAADGSAESYSPALSGRLINIIYTKDDFAAGVDFTITAESSGINLWTESDVNSSKTVAPRQPTHSQAGVEQDTAGDVLLGDIYLAQERVKIVIAQGGNAKSGSFGIIVDGPTG
jgi:hypothetical protein